MSLMGLIALTGNYCFFNLLVIALSLSLLDNAFLQRLAPRLRLNAHGPPDGLPIPASFPWLALSATPLLLLGLWCGAVQTTATLFQIRAMPRWAATPLEWVAPLRTINNYGLFAVMTKLGAYAVIRFGLLVFPNAVIGTLWGDLIYWSALATILIGGLGAMAARGLPLLISYAAIGSMGVVFLGISTFTPTGLAAALFYMLHSTLATALLFLLTEGRSRGLFLAGAIAMVGLPPLSGFVGKVLILQAVPDPLAWVAVLLGSLLTMIGFAKIGSDIYWKSDEVTSESTLWPVSILLVAIIALTICAAPVMTFLSDPSLFDLPAYIAVQNLGGM